MVYLIVHLFDGFEYFLDHLFYRKDKNQKPFKDIKKTEENNYESKDLNVFENLEYKGTDRDGNKFVILSEYSDFNNMQKIDQGKGKNYLSNYKGNFGKSPGRVRKGKVNDYLDVLEKEDVDFIKKIQEIQDENMSNG